MVQGKNKRRKRFTWFIVILLSVVSVTITISVIVVSQNEPPTKDLQIAREAISLAKEAEADLYAEKLYKESVQMYDSAMASWGRENLRFILFRDYGRAISFAKKANTTAEKAKDESIQKAHNLSKNVEEAFVSLAKKIELYNKLFKNLPLSRSVFEAHNKARMYLSESKVAQETGKLKEAEVLYKKADIYINHANTSAGKMLRGYFSDYPKWKSMANDAIAQSRGGSKVILVDKVAHVLYVYQSGKVLKSYPAELGPNWMAHKQHAGDKATPEGNYKIASKKERGSTIYHKALLIDYPNAEDRRQFALKKQKGLLHRNTGIGSLIEIHGNGGKGFDWTSGCVGLRDKDIDDLYRQVSVGTRVTIVGSMEPLSAVTGGVDF
jgi:lipoprotein-anchoring transpeptidase ErfK/SrfK